ncbi:hypothetical protein EJB05_01734, partial [Eragrostis curvula]
MAGAVVSVSTGVMNSLLSKLSTLLSEQYKQLKGIRRDIEFLGSELSDMNAALEKLSKIQELKARVVEQSERRYRYKLDEATSQLAVVAVDPRLPALYVEEAELVGIDGPQEKITRWLMEEESGSRHQLKLVSIVGFGGLGKTTLANQVYTKIRNKFDCSAFVVVSRNPDMLKVLNALLAGVGYNNTQMPDDLQKAIDIIREHLAKKSSSRKNSEVKRAWLGVISGWVTDLEVLPRCARECGPGLEEAGRYSGIRADSRGFTGACGRSCAGMVRMAGVGPEWSHSMALDARTWPRGDVPGLGLTDEDVGLLRGSSRKNSEVKRAWLGVISGWVTDREVLPRYLIVIDDIWNIEAWDIIKCGFSPTSFCGRVITTTRIESVAKACCLHCYGQVYNMQPLDDLQSRRLFFKKIFRSEDVCPEQYRSISEDMLRKCKGVPLAINSIASLLASQGIGVEKWEKIQNSLFSELETNPALEWMRSVPNLSYNDLSHELKTCLLYLGTYPEDYPIKKVDLLRRWIAEGFVREKYGLDLEEVAATYFDELINRSMIQPGKIIRGEMYYCRVHDLMLDLIISKCTGENFVTLLNKHYRRKIGLFPVRRLCCQFSNEILDLGRMDLSKVRSFTTFPASECMRPPLSKFEFLRVLNLQVNRSDDSECLDLSPVCSFFLLRYLRARGFRHLKLPEKFWKLQNLMTLDLGDSELVSCIPSGITSLSSLRHLTLPRGAALPNGISKLGALRSLEDFDLGKNSLDCIRDLGELTNLQDLILRHDNRNTFQPLSNTERLNYETLAVSLCKLGNSNLRTVIADSNVSLGRVLACSFSHPRLLRWLHLYSRTPAVPKWMLQAIRLTSLILEVTELCRDDVQVLAGLPCLNYLDLVAAEVPNRNTMIRIHCKEFPCLKEFNFKYDMLSLTFEPGAMPKLESLDLTFKGGSVVGIEHLASLEEISVYLKALPCDLSKIKSEISDAVGNHPRNHTIRRKKFIFTPYKDERE